LKSGFLRCMDRIAWRRMESSQLEYNLRSQSPLEEKNAAFRSP